ncbi:MAG: hypothetical protein K6G58_06285 [Lachnospiraceae bacterium]|nr:hypothetical protein [Lachnospiraceae bacterium]
MNVKPLMGVFAAVILISLSAFVTEGRASDEEKTAAVVTGAAAEGIVGTWHLSYNNDQEQLDEAFPDIYAFGNELVIRPDGRIFWHIGAAGAAGTYEDYGSQLAVCASDIMESDEYRIGATVDGSGKLTMTYKSVPLEWEFRSGKY